MVKIRVVLLILQFLCSNSTAITPAPVSPTRFTSGNSEPSSIMTLDVVTVYNPVPEQCDTSPLVTASNQRISKTKLRSGDIRWIALSRDLLKRWGGNVQYGDTIRVHSGDAAIDGLWVVQDTMHRRFRNSGDLLFDASVRTRGRWSNVRVVLQSKTASIDPAED